HKYFDLVYFSFFSFFTPFQQNFHFFHPFSAQIPAFWAVFRKKTTLLSRNSADSSLFSASFCFFASFLQKFC
ncbi:hypothetical protein AB1I39_22960, partial [Chromobacterium vaccinii]|uniref:hypothetical protein n=1 Tax=Chromobacterium vaccinii TaxID=1108595 RepID=UPI00345A6C45